MVEHRGVAGHGWNWGLSLIKQILDYNQSGLQEKIKFSTVIGLHKWLVALFPGRQWLFNYYKSWSGI